MSEPKLKQQQQNAIFLLASGKTITETAMELDINRGTLYKWFDNKDFVYDLTNLRKDIMDLAKTELVSLYTDAFSTLTDLMKNSSDSIKLRIAIFLIQNILQLDANHESKLTNFF